MAYFKDVTAQSVCDGIALSLRDATISGRLILGDVCVKSGSGLALGADCLNVGGNTTFDDFVAQTASRSDTFRMVGTRIGGTLSLDGARITNAPGDVRGVSRIECGNALNADGIEVRGDASFAMRLLVEATLAIVYSADDGCDVGVDSGSAVSPDYSPSKNAFSGRVKGVQLAIAEAADAEGHMVSPEDAVRIAMARQ